jgi:phosphomevalonate kinase
MMTLSTLTARAPGKLVLVGEYSVLEGGPAWVTAVDRYVTVRALEGNPGLTVFAPEQRTVPLRWNDVAWQAGPEWRLATEAMTEAFGAALPRLEIDSRDFFLPAPGGPAKAGFGSSAAVVAALLKAGRYAGAAPEALLAAARAVHHRAQGSVGSGVDIAASVYGGTFIYRIDGDRARVRPLNIPAAVAVTAVWMGTSASTPDLVRKVLDFKLDNRAEYDELMAKLRLTAGDALYRAERNDVLALFDALGEYGRRMGQLGRAAGVPIVTEAMEELDSLLAGDAAVKPSGAGGGDVLLAFHRPDKAFDVARKLRGAGFDTIPLGFGAPGAMQGHGSRNGGHEA